MSTVEFLSHLRNLKVELSIEGEHLRLNAPNGILTAELQAELEKRKQEILGFLHQANGTAAVGMQVRPVPRDGNLALSFAQQRLWFLDQLEPGTCAYTLGCRRLLQGSLDITLLSDVLTELVRRHESLRTTFGVKDGVPFQRIASPGLVRLSVVDLTGAPAADLENIKSEIFRLESKRPFDLATGPLFRPLLLRFGTEQDELVTTIHHIVTDGWSMGIIACELQVLYDAYANAQPAKLPEAPLQYADFALWQREWLSGDHMASQRRYWLQQLAGWVNRTELHPDYERKNQQAWPAASHDSELGAALASSLRQLARREKATLFMVLLAGFKMLLARYTGQEDIVVGTPVANRQRVELEPIVGFFTNTLVLRTDLSGDPSFREAIRRVREVSLGAFAHQDFPFEKLVEELQSERKLGQNPLFDISFVYQTGATGGTLSFVTVSAAFDVTLFVTELEQGGLRIAFEYKRDIFAAETVAALAVHYRALLEGLAADPDCRLSAASLMTDVERHQLLFELNATAAEYPRERTIHGLFEDQAAATPEAVALTFHGTSLTYRELDARANGLAHYLRDLGVGPEYRVGIWMERSVEMLVAVIGILKAGGAYVPLDLAAPPERLKIMLADAGISILLAQQRMLAKLPTHNARVVCLDALPDVIAWQPETPLSHSGTPEALAYAMYTSGSTGEPKAVAVTHRNVVRLVKATNYADFGPHEVFLQLAPLSFDASTFEIWGALLNGACLVLAPPGPLSIDQLANLIKGHVVTTLWLTAGLFHEVVDNGIYVLKPLRQLLAGGDVLFPAHVQKALAELPTCRLINGYGPTEGTTFSCCYSINRESRLERSVPIGRPIANTTVYILDGNLQPVPIGVPGELYIGGDGIARGYLNHPELTAKKFIPDPLSAEPSARLYKTGDLARYLPDGNIEFLGRKDGQVKIRGFRIELEEIETLLREHPAVKQAVVLATEAASGDKRLIAFLVPANGASPSAPELRLFLRRKLPDYMLPAVFMTVESIPLTANGKIDRRALPIPGDEHREVPEIVTPTNQLEHQLVEIWEEELAVRPIGIHDNFFDLGGHSLLAVRVFARIERSLGVRLPLAELFRAPTIRGLAQIIYNGKSYLSWRSLVPIKIGGSRPPIFAVPGVGGNVICYADLARLVGIDQPFYGLQSRGLDGSEKPLTCIEDIAAVFLTEIRELQPVGPYYLMGACMGGVVAYEIAQQLRAAGEKVEHLILLETWLAVPTVKPGVRSNIRFATALHLLKSRFRLTFDQVIALRGRRRFEYLLGRLKILGKMIVQRDVFRGDYNEFYLQLVTHANLVALQSYQPKKYEGRVSLFRAEDRQVAHDDLRVAWSRLITGNLEIHDVPGNDSGSMLIEPHVRVLARKLEKCIMGTNLMCALFASAIDFIGIGV